LGLGVLAALIVGALAALVGPQIERGAERVVCEIVHIGLDGKAGSCPAEKPPPVAGPQQPTTSQARCVRDQGISYVEALGYVRPRIVGGRGDMRWTTTTRTISHGPGKPDTYEVTLQTWKEGAVEAGIEGGDNLPIDALAYIGLNATEGKTFAFNTKQEADDFQKQVPHYFIGGTAYDATKTLAGPVGTVLGVVDSLTGGHVKNWAEGSPPKPQQEYHEVGPTAGAELGADIPLGGGNKIAVGGKGRFWRLYGRSEDHSTGDTTYYLRQNNQLVPSVTINLAGFASAWKGLTGKDLQAAISKVVLAQTGRSIGIPANVAEWVLKNGNAGLSLKWKPNTQYLVTYDKDGNLTRVDKVDDSILTWYAQASIKGPSIGADDPGAEGLISIASSRTTETDTLNVKTPEDRSIAENALANIAVQSVTNAVTPPSDANLDNAINDHGTKTRLHYDNDVKTGKIAGRSYGVKGLIGLELSGEDEQDHLAGAQYWDPSTASWKTWTNCR
jgi:hypothetical protein